jgi:hypothetical protein
MMVLLAFTGLYPEAAVAQYEGLQSGTRIRISLNAGEGLPALVTKGYLKDINKGHLIFVNDYRTERKINQDQIIMLEQLSGSRRHGFKGFLIGAAVGGVLGFALGTASSSSSDDPILGKGIGQAIAQGTLMAIGVPVGGVLGLFVGLATVTEKWEPVAPVYPVAPIAASGYTMPVLPRSGIRISF